MLKNLLGLLVEQDGGIPEELCGAGDGGQAETIRQLSLSLTVVQPRRGNVMMKRRQQSLRRDGWMDALWRWKGSNSREQLMTFVCQQE